MIRQLALRLVPMAFLCALVFGLAHSNKPQAMIEDTTAVAR